MRNRFQARTTAGHLVWLFVEHADKALEAYARMYKGHPHFDSPEANVYIKTTAGVPVFIRTQELRTKKARHVFQQSITESLERRLLAGLPAPTPAGEILRRHVFVGDPPMLFGFPIITSDKIPPGEIRFEDAAKTAERLRPIYRRRAVFISGQPSSFLLKKQCEGRLHRPLVTPRVECAACGNEFISRSASQPCGIRSCPLAPVGILSSIPQADGDDGRHLDPARPGPLPSLKDLVCEDDLEIPFLHRWSKTSNARCLKCGLRKWYVETVSKQMCKGRGPGSPEESILRSQSILRAQKFGRVEVPAKDLIGGIDWATPEPPKHVDVRLEINIRGRETVCVLTIGGTDCFDRKFESKIKGRARRHPLDPVVPSIGAMLALTRALAEAASKGLISSPQTAKVLGEAAAVMARREAK